MLHTSLKTGSDPAPVSASRRVQEIDQANVTLSGDGPLIGYGLGAGATLRTLRPVTVSLLGRDWASYPAGTGIGLCRLSPHGVYAILAQRQGSMTAPGLVAHPFDRADAQPGVIIGSFSADALGRIDPASIRIVAPPPEPAPPAWAGLDISGRMALVMRRQQLMDLPTTEDDFREAEETCDLTPTELHAQIGAAKRRMLDTLDGAPTPAIPRAERLETAVNLLAGLVPNEAALVAELRRSGFGHAEIADLWSDLAAALATRVNLFDAVRGARG